MGQGQHEAYVPDEHHGTDDVFASSSLNLTSAILIMQAQRRLV